MIAIFLVIATRLALSPSQQKATQAVTSDSRESTPLEEFPTDSTLDDSFTSDPAGREGIEPSRPQATQTTATLGQSPVAEREPIVQPLAFYHPPSEQYWTKDQLQTLDNLRNDFATILGGWNQNPSDPRYGERWIEAQPVFDERFQTLFGDEALSEQQTQAAHSP